MPETIPNEVWMEVGMEMLGRGYRLKSEEANSYCLAPTPHHFSLMIAPTNEDIAQAGEWGSGFS